MTNLEPTIAPATETNGFEPAFVKTGKVLGDYSPLPATPGYKSGYAERGVALTQAVVVKTGTDVGWYGKDGDKPYLPLGEFVARFGEPDLEAQVEMRISYHWDSGHPDTFKMVPKWQVLGYPADANLDVLCRDGMEELYPERKEARLHREHLDRAYAMAIKVEKGRRVRVVKGRKVAIGTEGECFWLKADDYGGERVGIKDDEGTVHWTSKANCVAVVDGDTFVY